jgi:hypothetical protein
MNQVIIFQNNEGGVAVVIPSPEALASHAIQEVAIKDVPAGKPFKIIDASELPTDRTERNLWTVDAALLTDGVGGESNEFGG